MKSMKKFFNRFVTDERGLAAVEYAVVAGLVAVALVVVFGEIGDNAAARLGDLRDALDTTTPAP